MKRPTTLAGLLRAIERETKGYADQCEYILMAGPHPAYRLRQMKRKADKQLASIRRSVDALHALGLLWPDVARVNAATERVIDECHHFPRDAEWPGVAAMQQQEMLIEALIQQGRWR